jgi:puromycin-sensitive aminopeptidase
MSASTSDRNFRLPVHVRPIRYRASVDLDLSGKRFTGREIVDLALSRSTGEIVLHAVDLQVRRVRCRAGGRTLEPASIEAAPASQTLVLGFEEMIPAGAAELEIEWAGAFSPGLRGLYAAGALAVTQFEAADARRLFPCFDEPAFKASWALELEVPKGAAALSNGAPISQTEVGDRLRIAFRETPPLSTYLVALVVGPIAPAAEGTVRGIPVRTWAVPEKSAFAAFGQEVALSVLPRLEDYFGIPYAFGKLDQAGIPDFEAGAMENAGLVTYREVALLLDPATAALSAKKRVAEVVTHELAHQWFGNWVTMAWWDDLWLNEAFATWMSFKIVDGWKPEWRIWLDFDAGKAAAMQLDALRSTHPIRSEVHNAEEATESFDLITYEKGGAVLRMIEGYLGADRFRDGIRLYMRRHARANATADDLWGALAEASKEPVVDLANAWIRQGGHPLLRVERRGTRLELSQHRFLSEPGRREEDRTLWPVPVVLRYADGAGVRERRLLLRNASETVELEATGEIRWLCANAGATGFYRVASDPASLAALHSSLGALQPAERIGLLSDEWALVRAGERDVATFLDLCAAFGAEEDYAVLDELTGRLASVEHRLVADADLPAFRAFVAALLGAQFQRTGWDAAAGEEDGGRLRRAALVRALGVTARQPEVVQEGTRRLVRVLGGARGALEANLHDAAAVMAAREGDSRRFEAFQAAWRAEADPAFKRRYLLALAAFEDPPSSARAGEMALGEGVPLQDSASFIGGLLGNRVSREGFWEALRARWGEVSARLGGAPMLLRRVIEAMGQLPERRHLEQAEALLAAHPVEVARQAVAQTLERMRQDVALRERAQGQIARWLASRKSS